MSPRLVGMSVPVSRRASPQGSSFLEQGLAALRAGAPVDARKALVQATREQPKSEDARYLLAIACHQLGDLGAARKSLKALGQLGPLHPQALNLLAVVEQDDGCLEAAEAAYREAIRRQPADPGLHNNLGTVLRARGNLEGAHGAFDMALGLDPNHVEALTNKANAFVVVGRHDEAEVLYSSALARAPGHGRALLGRGKARLQLGNHEGAAGDLEAAAAHPATRDAATWHAALALPPVYASVAEMDGLRGQMLSRLEALVSVPIPDSPARDPLVAAAGEMTTFTLHYQDTDVRPAQEAFGDYVSRLTAPYRPRLRPSRASKPRVGVVSHHLYEHTVGKFVRGWTKHMADEAVELRFFQMGPYHDAFTEWFAARAPLEHLSVDLESASRTLAESRLDAILYPELGMYGPIYRLASVRLAPLQVAALGHPVTSGLPSIDAFLSGEDVEPLDGQAHYSERLECLPGTSLTYEEPQWSGAIPDLDLPSEAFVFLTLQSLFKYLPQHDALYARILAQCPSACLVFLSSGSRALDARFQQRLRAALAREGVDIATRCRFLERRPLDEFLGVYRRADVVLDVPSWSGGNTTLEALSAGRPIISWPGRFARGRVTKAMLEAIGVTETLVHGPDAYVETAVALYDDADLRERLSERILASKSVLFEDSRPVRAMEALFGLGNSRT